MNTDIFSVFKGQQLTSGRPSPGLTNAAPLPAKLEMIWCAWGNTCMRHFRPQTSHVSASMLSDGYNEWNWYFYRPQRTKTHLRATLSRFDKCNSPPCFRDQIGYRMQFDSVNDFRVNLNGCGSTQLTSCNAGSNSGTLKLPHQHFLWNYWVLSLAVEYF